MPRTTASRRPAVPIQRPVAVEVFAGIGGLSLGLERAGFDVAAAIELDANHAAVHRFNFPLTTLLQTDAAGVTKEAIEAAVVSGLKAHRRPDATTATVDLIAGGPPCQGFSTGGTHSRGDQRNELLFAFARIVAEIRPRFFVMENVPGLLHAKHAETWNSLIEVFKEAGYDTAAPAVLNATDFGVPQQRKRMFLYGWRTGEAAISPPQPLKGNGVSVRAAFALLPDAGRYDYLYESDILPVASLDSACKARMKRKGSEYALAMRASNGGWGFNRPWLTKEFTGMALTSHEAKVVKRFRAAEPGSREPISRYARLAWSGQSPTLRSGTGRDHGSHTPPRPIHPDGERVITVREAARLQSFPDWFAFHATKWHAWRGIGNSVPPILAHVVVSQIAASFTIPLTQQVSLPFGDPTTIGYKTKW